MRVRKGFLLYFLLSAAAALPIAAWVAHQIGSLLGYATGFSLTSVSFAAGQALTEEARTAVLLAGPTVNLALCLVALVAAYVFPSHSEFLIALSLGNNYARAITYTLSALFAEPNPYDLDVIKVATYLGWWPGALVLVLLPIYVFALLLATRMVRGGESAKLLFVVSTIAIGLLVTVAIHAVDPLLFPR